MKIGNTTVRGGWSSKYVYGEIDGYKFQLSAKENLSFSQVNYIKHKIENGKMELPRTSPQHLFYVLDNKTIEPIN